MAHTYTLTTAGAELGLSETTLSRLIRGRRDIARKLGKSWRITAAGVATLKMERAGR